MSDSQKPREFWLADRRIDMKEGTGKYIALDYEWPKWHKQIHVIEFSAYDQALKRIENLRAALLDLYETTKAEHGVHESEIEPWDSSSLGNAKGALADDQGEET